MHKKSNLFFLILFYNFTIQAQEHYWEVGFKYFFDNTEYSNSSFLDSESMNGIWLNPQGGILWNNRHSINAGVNLLKIPGIDNTIDKIDVTMYYQYKSPNIMFRAGSFPKNEVLRNYNNFFFTDSVKNFIPLMQGVFFQIGTDRHFLNAWLGRTGYATETNHEHFFIGLSGKTSRGLYFADFQSYMFHLSNTKPATESEGVIENLQLQSTIGIDYNKEDIFKGLIAAGVLLGYERNRRFEDELYKPVGLVIRGDAEIWGIGIRNLLYIGENRMRLATTFGGDLYWGTQFLRSSPYLRSELYIRLIESDLVKLKFNFNLHFNESKVMSQQMLTLSATIDNTGLLDKKNVVFPWMKIFNR